MQIKRLVLLAVATRTPITGLDAQTFDQHRMGKATQNLSNITN